MVSSIHASVATMKSRESHEPGKTRKVDNQCPMRVHLHDAVTNSFPGIKRPCSLIHFTGVLEQAGEVGTILAHNGDG